MKTSFDLVKDIVLKYVHFSAETETWVTCEFSPYPMIKELADAMQDVSIKPKYVINHPGTLEPIFGDDPLELENKWFEGFNGVRHVSNNSFWTRKDQNSRYYQSESDKE